MRLALTALLALATAAGAGRTAFWLRPPATAAELERTLVAARQAGFTDVLLEGFYHGRTIWPSRVAPMKTSYDALAVAARVAEREGLALNVWFETLYWRPADKFGVPPSPLWKDAWATRTADGRTSLDRSDLGFVDPAEPGVGDVLEALVREAAERAPGAGLHLDYLRLPREAEFGFHPASLEEFRRRSGRDARDLRAVADDAADRLVWTEVRRDAVSRLAGRLIAAYRNAGGRGLVSAAVFSGRDPVQDWRSWPGLQAAMPMLYLPSAAFYPLALLAWPRGEGLWPGVRAHGGAEDLRAQLDAVRAAGFPNVAVFDWRP